MITKAKALNFNNNPQNIKAMQTQIFTTPNPKGPTKREVLISLISQKENAKVETSEHYILITYTHKGLFVYAIWSNRGHKPVQHIALKTEAQREQYINSSKKGIIVNANAQKLWIEKNRQESDTIQKGQILYSSWGHEQTNVDFYKVIDRVNNTLTLVPIASKRTASTINGAQYDDRGKCEPDDSKQGQPFKIRVGKTGSLKINSYQYLSKYDGKPKYWSSYA